MMQQPAFSRLALEAEEQPAARGEVPLAAGRSVAPRTARRRLILGGVSLVAAGAAAAALAAGRPAPAAGAAPGASLGAFAVKPFHQCGGARWTNSTCCQRGCACIIVDKYYSQCEPPAGSKHCDQRAALDEAEATKLKVSAAKPVAVAAAKKAKETAEVAAKATAEAEKAEGSETLKRLKADGAMKRKAKEATQAAAKAAKDRAEEEGKKMWHQESEYNKTKARLDHIEANERMAATGLCPGMFGACKGGGVAPSKACCQLGCVCQMKNAFYGQCRAPDGHGACDPQGVKDEAAALKKKAAAELKELEATRKRAAALTVDAKEKAEHAEKARKEAIVAGTKKTKAIQFAQGKRSVADEKQRVALAAKRKAEHAANSVKYTSASVDTWKAVAAGHTCSKADAAERVGRGGGGDELRFLEDH